MFRRFNLLTKNDVEVVLMKNIREELAEIPREYITSVTYDETTYPKMEIEVPSHVTRANGTKVEVFLFNQIKGKQTIFLSINGVKTKFVIDEDVRVLSKPTGQVKSLSAYSYEKTLEKKSFMINEGATRQLYRPADEEVEISDGILNWVEQQTNWKVGYVDAKARKETGVFNVIDEVVLFTNFSKEKVEKNKLLWSKSVNIEAERSFSIVHKGLHTFEGELLLKSENITHSLSGLKRIKQIEAYYSSDSTYRFGIMYYLTYEDGSRETHKFGFANVNNLTVEVDSIYLAIQTGELEERLTTKYRYFDHCTTTWYAFLMNEVAESFDCVFVFDSYNMTINCYSRENYGRESGLYISYENGIKDINKTHKVGETVSRLYVNSPNVSIAEINNLGTEYVECFDYYIREGFISSELQQALTRYNAYLDKKQVEWLQLKLDKNKADQEVTVKDSELISLQERYKVENAILTAYIKANNVPDKQKEQSELVEQLDKEIQALMSHLQSLKDKATDLYNQMLEVGRQIAKEVAEDEAGKIFTDLDLEELEEYIVEGSLDNDYYTTAYALYNHALEKVKDLNKVAIDFTINTDNLLKRIVHPNGWQEVIGLGEKIMVEDSEIVGTDGYIQLTGFVYSPKNEEINTLKFTNNKKPVSAIKTIGDIGRKTSQQSNMTNYWKSTWQDAKNNNVNVEKLFKEGLDVASQIIRGKGTVNKIDISESGIYVIDASNDNNQLYLGSGIVSFTQDRWKTSELALSPEGLVSNSLVGKIILADKLFIGNEDNTFQINPNGLSIYDNDSSQEERIFLGLEMVNGVKKARLRLHSANADKKLVLSEDGMYQVIPVHAMDNFDKDNALECAFYISENIQSIHRFSLRVKLGKFRAYSKTSKSGGGVSTSKTSKSSGSFSVSSSTNMGGYSKQTVGTKISIGENMITQPPVLEYQSFNEQSYKIHRHEILPELFEHTHDIIIPDHSHNFKVSQDGHTHNVEIEIEPHTHGMNYGIYEYGSSPTVNIYLDSTLIASNVSSSQTYDITSKTSNLSKGWHYIKIVGVSSSNNAEGLGRASIDASIGAFVSF